MAVKHGTAQQAYDEGRHTGARNALLEVDAVCRRLMMQAAEDQATLGAVSIALDKVRIRIRELIKTPN